MRTCQVRRPQPVNSMFQWEFILDQSAAVTNLQLSMSDCQRRGVSQRALDLTMAPPSSVDQCRRSPLVCTQNWIRTAEALPQVS